MQLLVDLLALAYATSMLVTAWLQKDGLFAGFLLKVDAWGSPLPTDFVEGTMRWWPWTKHKIAFGMQCATCLSFHFAFWLAILFLAPSFGCKHSTALLVKTPIYVLATARFALSLQEDR